MITTPAGPTPKISAHPHHDRRRRHADHARQHTPTRACAKYAGGISDSRSG
jgi:hypothetical protein